MKNKPNLKWVSQSGYSRVEWNRIIMTVNNDGKPDVWIWDIYNSPFTTVDCGTEKTKGLAQRSAELACLSQIREKLKEMEKELL